MKGRILQQLDHVTLLGGGGVNLSILRECLDLAPRLVAVDGGADAALAHGFRPEQVIGDLDSVSDQTRARLSPDRIIETPDQNRTDFDKALERVAGGVVLGVGFMGGRLDHELACYNALVRSSARCVLVGEEDLCFHLPDQITLDLSVGTRLSLFPMARVTGHCAGLKYPVAGLEMAPWGRIGTSNEVSAPEVRLRFDGPGMLVILPRAHLATVVAALAATAR